MKSLNKNKENKEYDKGAKAIMLFLTIILLNNILNLLQPNEFKTFNGREQDS